MTSRLRPELADGARQRAVLKRAARVEDVADQVVAFCRSDSVTGQVAEHRRRRLLPLVEGGLGGPLRASPCSRPARLASQAPAVFSILAQVSRRPTVRLKTGRSGRWSFQSATK